MGRPPIPPVYLVKTTPKEPTEMYLRSTETQVNIGAAGEVVDRLRDDVIVAISQQPGFFAYYVVELPDNVVATVRVFEDLGSLDAATDAVAEVVHPIAEEFGLVQSAFYEGEVGTGVAYARLFL